LSHELRRQPLGFCIFQPEVLGRGQRGGRGFDRPNLATVIAGGEGGGMWEHHQVLAHLQTYEIGVGVTCSGGAMRAGGRRQRRPAEAALRWSRAARKGSGSFRAVWGS
jgi:hypothetical protein